MHPHIFVPFMQFSRPGLILAIRAQGGLGPLAARLQDALAEIDRSQPVTSIRPLEHWISDSTSNRRFQTLLLATFAVMALVLAAVGIYGVLAFSVNQRRREIGIRVALGAQKFEVLGLVIRQGMGLTFVGILIGLAGAFAVARLMSAFLFETAPFDPVTFVTVAFILTIVSFAACWLPARRAAKIDPMEALRYE
jgi:putative ABC transport system permease protein